MLNQSAHLTGVAVAGTIMMETIKSRFGDVTVDLTKTVSFPRGLLGMPDKSRFALASFPATKMQQFTLLQSLDDHALSFITLPLGIRNGIIAEQDVRTASHDLQIADANLAMCLIVSVHRMPGQVRLSANARAPLMIDTFNLVGAQYVFSQDQYKVQHML